MTMETYKSVRSWWIVLYPTNAILHTTIYDQWSSLTQFMVSLTTRDTPRFLVASQRDGDADDDDDGDGDKDKDDDEP